VARALLLREEILVGRPARSRPEPLVTLDPVTGDAELVLDYVLDAIEPGGPLNTGWPLDELREPPPGDAPFRAVVLTQQVNPLELRPPLLPGARTPERPNARRDDPTLEELPPFVGPAGVLPRPNRPEIVLTDFPVRVTATGAQPLEVAQDVHDVDELVCELRVLSLSGASASVTMELQTGMQVESSLGWVSAGSFVAVTSAPATQLRVFSHLLHYIRWNVSALTGTSATFFLSCVGRQWSRRS